MGIESKSVDFDSGLESIERVAKSSTSQKTSRFSQNINFFISLKKDKIIFRNTVWVSNLKALDSSFESIVPLKELQQKKFILQKKCSIL